MATQVPYVAVPPGIASRVGSVFGRTGNVVAEAGDYSAAQIAGGLSRVATTGPAGFALQDATPTILSWAAPNDGQLHTAFLVAVLAVSAAETGGQISFGLSGDIGTVGPVYQGTVYGAGFGVGVLTAQAWACAVPPGNGVICDQSSALTAGAATVYAEIWAA